MHLKTVLPLLSSTTLAFTLTVTPIISQQLTGLNLGSIAIAKDGGGNGGGNSGGNGGNNNGNKGSSQGNGNAFGLGNSVQGKSNKSASQGFNSNNGLGNDHKAVSAKLGRLNAAHASATARENASQNSAVGLLAQYEKTVYEAREATSEKKRAELEQSAMDILGQAANKEINEEVITAVNVLLGIEPEIAPEADTDNNSETETDEEAVTPA